MNKQYIVDFFILPYHDVFSSSLLSGLFLMANKKEIILNFSFSANINNTQHLTHLNVTHIGSGRSKTIVIDISDRYDRFCQESLDFVDIYYKRSFNSKTISNLKIRGKDKIRSSGLTYGCRAEGTTLMFLKLFWLSYLLRLRLERTKRFIHNTYKLINDVDHVLSLLYDHQWERSATDMPLNGVIYQTRIYSDEDLFGNSREAVNGERISLVKALRAEFGKHDLIGLLRGNYTREVAPDCVLSRKIKRSEYAFQLRKNLVNVNSHGLDKSMGLKVGESLAAGSALVSQPFETELPVPLLPEENYLPFSSVDECITQCKRLLADRQLADYIRKNNVEYYQKHVKPESHIRNLLDDVFRS